MTDENFRMVEGGDVEVAKEKLPEAVLLWRDIFIEISKKNSIPSILAYFNLLGTVLKDDIDIPMGMNKEDTRIHVCWIQTARSGKSVLNDFYSQICEKTFEFINTTYNTDFNVFDIVDFTDAGLIGTNQEITNPNPTWREDGQQRKIMTQTRGALEGSGIALFDEFESSGVFTNKSHRESVVTIFQKFMNTLTTSGYLYKKKLGQGEAIECDCQRSTWATTYVPENLTATIATKGVLQRMFFYIREVPQETLNEMRYAIINEIGTSKERKTPSEKFAKAILLLLTLVKERREQVEGNKELVIEWAAGVRENITGEYDNMQAYMSKVPENVRKTVGLFETNSLLYLTKLSVLCTVSETPARADNEKWVVFPRNVRQAAWIVRQGYMSLVSWMLQALKTQRVSIAEDAGLVNYIEAYNYLKMATDDDWVLKAALRVKLEQDYELSQAKFYRDWNMVKDSFNERKISKTVYVKLKEE